MNGIDLKESTNKKKKLIILMIPLLISNWIVFLLASPSAESPKIKGHVQTIIKGELKTPFQEYKEVSLVHRKTKQIIKNCLLLNIEDVEDSDNQSIKNITISILESEMANLKDATYQVYPNIKDLLIQPTNRKRISYEISY